MTEPGNSPVSGPTPELRAELAACEDILEATAPALRLFLAAGESFLLSDEIIARVRGMLSDLERQLLHALADAAGKEDAPSSVHESTGAFLAILGDIEGLLRHVHSLAVETYVSELFRVRNGLDPVLTPMLQNFISSEDEQLSASAMAVLTAQARFVQSQRRMELPLQELPAELHEQTLQTLRSHPFEDADAGAVIDKAISILRAQYDASRSRLALLSRLIMSIEGGPAAALSLELAGMAMFASALAVGSGQARETVLLSSDVSQSTRLLLMLRVGGLSSQAVATQILTLHPTKAIPAWLVDLPAEQARLLLASTTPVGME